jgi:hypothetical protein
MAAIVINTPPAAEPLSLAETKLHLGLGPWQDSDHITSANQATRIRDLITAAREYCSTFTRRAFVNTGFIQYLDSFPYYTDTVMSQQAYPPAYYSLPRYSTTLWNYSQMIKLFYSPLVSVRKITYIATNGMPTDLRPGTPGNQNGDFVVDITSEPPRLFPNSGQNWPPVLYVPNAVAIYFTAGYGAAASSVPASVRVAMRQLVRLWDSDPSQIGKKNPEVERLLWSIRVLDISPTRG